MDDLERRLEHMLETQEIDQALIEEIMALPPGDPRTDRIISRLTAIGADQGPSPVLNIEDYYQPGDQVFTLRWPLAPPTQAVLPFPFDALDRKTQFFVLFQEWTRRDLEANTARNAGDLDGAQAIFEECLARAEQLDVAELKARSYEGMASVAEKLRHMDEADRFYQAAESLRDAIET